MDPFTVDSRPKLPGVGALVPVKVLAPAPKRLATFGLGIDVRRSEVEEGADRSGSDLKSLCSLL